MCFEFVACYKLLLKAGKSRKHHLWGEQMICSHEIVLSSFFLLSFKNTSRNIYLCPEVGVITENLRFWAGRYIISACLSILFAMLLSLRSPFLEFTGSTISTEPVSAKAQLPSVLLIKPFIKGKSQENPIHNKSVKLISQFTVHMLKLCQTKQKLLTNPYSKAYVKL